MIAPAHLGPSDIPRPVPARDATSPDTAGSTTPRGGRAGFGSRVKQQGSQSAERRPAQSASGPSSSRSGSPSHNKSVNSKTTIGSDGRTSSVDGDEEDAAASFHSVLSQFASNDDKSSQAGTGDGTKKQNGSDSSDSSSGNDGSTRSATTPIEIAANSKQILPFVLAIPKATPASPADVIDGVAGTRGSAGPSGALNLTGTWQESDVREIGKDLDNETDGEGGPASAAQPAAPASQVDANPVVGQKGELAFAAKMIPNVADSNPQTPLKASTAVGQPQKSTPIAPQASNSADTTSDKIGSAASNAIQGESTIKPAAVFMPEGHQAPAFKIETSTPLANAATNTPAARMEEVIELRPAPPSSASDITVRIADAERGTDVRFVERAGEVHVSVRTADEGMAQTLRSGLNDLAARMEQGGVRTELWRPNSDNGSDNSSSQNQSERRPSDQKGSQRDQTDSGDSEDAGRNSRKPKWVEALELSIGRQA